MSACTSSSVPLALCFRFLERGVERGPRLFLALQQAQPSRDHLGEISLAAGGDRLGREALQFGRQGDMVRGPNIGSAGAVRKRRMRCPTRRSKEQA